jgi:hypothetical protein
MPTPSAAPVTRTRWPSRRPPRARVVSIPLAGGGDIVCAPAMRASVLAALVVLVTLAAPAAHADVGPPPSCPPGTRRIYNQGYKCVSDTPQADPPIDPDAPRSPTATASSTFATPPSTEPSTEPAAQPAADPAPQPVTPPSQRGCALAAFVAALLLLARRRR